MCCLPDHILQANSGLQGLPGMADLVSSCFQDSQQRLLAQALITFLQNMPTDTWGDREVEMLLAEAFRLKYAFHGAQSHVPSAS